MFWLDFFNLAFEMRHNRIEKAVSSVFFSATMLPMHYYKELLTTEKDAFAIYVDSPFDNRKRLLAVAEDVSSRYTMRNEMQYRRIFNYILQTVSCKKGNYMVFFPSYQYMMEIAALYDEMAEKEKKEYGTSASISCSLLYLAFASSKIVFSCFNCKICLFKSSLQVIPKHKEFSYIILSFTSISN